MADEDVRVLVIEDEPRLAALIAKSLTGDGSEVTVAEDGEVGLFLVTTEHFDAVVLDVGLPGYSGLDVLRQIRAAGLDVPVVMLTGRDEPETRRLCLGAGASGFVTKPFVVADLRAKVAIAVRGLGS